MLRSEVTGFSFSFLEELAYCSPRRLHQFAFPPAAREGSLFCTLAGTFLLSFDDGHSDRCCMVVLIGVSLPISDVERGFTAVWMSSLENI